MDNTFKWNMYITSFIPLWLSIIIADLWSVVNSIESLWICKMTIKDNVLNVVQENLVAIIVIVIVAVFMLTSIKGVNNFIFYQKSVSQKHEAQVLKAKRANKLTSEFLLAYILPMIAFDFTELRSVVLFAVYFGMLAFLCIRNNNVYTNILLEIKGYKMYECELLCYKMEREICYEDCLVISKRNLTTHIKNNIGYWDFDNYIYIDLE